MLLPCRNVVALLIPALFFFLCVSLCHGVTPPVPDVPTGRIMDLAGIIDGPTEEKLDRVLTELEEKTGAQMVILTVASLDGEEINTFSLRFAEKWELGAGGKDNGLLLTVAVKERKYRFEVGYGLESVLPDSLVGSIGRDNLVPYFKAGEYSRGVAAATAAVLDILAEHYQIRFTSTGLPRPQTGSNDDDTIAAFLFFLGFVIFLILQIRRSRRREARGGKRRKTIPGVIPGGWMGSGGFGGGSGGFGGFSGGGGGFGGGGASGGW